MRLEQAIQNSTFLSHLGIVISSYTYFKISIPRSHSITQVHWLQVYHNFLQRGDHKDEDIFMYVFSNQFIPNIRISICSCVAQDNIKHFVELSVKCSKLRDRMIKILDWWYGKGSWEDEICRKRLSAMRSIEICTRRFRERNSNEG